MNEQLEEQASLYVFGLLESAEAAAFERRLESDADLRALVDELDAAAATIAHDAPARALPPAVRARVLSRISEGNKVIAFSRRSAWIPWALVAGLAVSCAYLVAESVGLRTHISRLEKRDFLSRIQIASLRSRLENAPNANAVVVWDEKKQSGVLKVTQLPRNAEDQDYQIWLVDPRYKNPVGGGIFHLTNDGTLSVQFHPNTPVRQAQAFSVSLERKGGVTKAEGPIVLLGK